MSFAVKLSIVRLDPVDNVLHDLTVHTLSNLLTVITGVEIKMYSQETV
jgi:hypothetical protein